MIMLIVVGGSMFSGVFYASGGMQSVQYILSEFGLAGWPTIALLLGITFLAGFLLDLISVVLILIPIAMPLVSQYGVDPLWFCVLFLIVLQTSYLTPPMAPAIFYMRAVAPPSITLMHMYKGVVPFILLELATLGIAILFPGVATWLPRQLYG
jgi:TRAP-type mannitol/chloroaromatic compound transport system permease large subunit